MQKVIFCQGLPASGKSTWSKKFCEDHPEFVRVCRDDLRSMRGKYWIPEQESMISVLERTAMITALQFKKNVIIDATNFNQGHVANLKFEALDITHGECEFEIKVFDTDVEECIRRDASRAERKVGEQVIRDFYNKHLRPKPIVQDENLPHVIICDLDGTIALSDGKRGWYEYKKCGSDTVNLTIVKLMLNYMSTGLHAIIYVSGREDYAYDATKEWLERHGLWQGHLYMRKTKDNRPDNIVKRELFDANIKDKFFVEFVLDDRNSVVKMWRELGLTCLQVADGNF
jgi:predicted kinase